MCHLYILLFLYIYMKSPLKRLYFISSGGNTKLDRNIAAIFCVNGSVGDSDSLHDADV